MDLQQLPKINFDDLEQVKCVNWSEFAYKSINVLVTSIDTFVYLYNNEVYAEVGSIEIAKFLLSDWALGEVWISGAAKAGCSEEVLLFMLNSGVHISTSCLVECYKHARSYPSVVDKLIKNDVVGYIHQLQLQVDNLQLQVDNLQESNKDLEMYRGFYEHYHAYVNNFCMVIIQHTIQHT